MRIFSAYGVGLRKQLLWDACCKGVAAAQAGEKTVEFFGTGEESRVFIHARDVAAQVAELLLRSLPGNLKPRFNGQEQQGDPKRWQADVSLLQSLGFVPTASFESELEAYALWSLKFLYGQSA